MSFFEVLKSEAKAVFSDVAIVLTIIGGVVLYAFLYPQPYIKESVSEIKVSVVDLDKTQLSRKVIFELNSTPTIDVYRVDLSIKDAKEALLSGVVKGVVVIPADFNKDILLNKSPTVFVGGNAGYFLIFGGVVEGAMKSVLSLGASFKVANLLKQQIPMGEAKELYSPYSADFIELFNPQNSYTQYVIPAVFVLILQQTMLIGLGILGGGINERIKKGERGYFSEASPLQLIFSKVTIFVFVFFIHLMFYFGFSFEFFGILHLANLQNLLIFSTLFLFASAFFGIFIGLLFGSREIATPVVLFSSLPLVFSAGFVWPLEALPEFIRYISLLFPSTPAIDGFLKINQMGADFSSVLIQCRVLILHICVYFTLSYVLLYIQRRRRVVS